jgi:hypothetical protein
MADASHRPARGLRGKAYDVLWWCAEVLQSADLRAIDSHGEAAESSREELELFVELLDEVFAEHPDSRPTIMRRIE